MKVKLFTGIFSVLLMVLVLCSQARQAQTAPQQVQLTEEQQTALIVQSAKKIKELKDKLDPKGPIVYVNGPTIQGLRGATEENQQKLKAYAKEVQLNQKIDLASLILVANGIKEPNEKEVHDALAEAERIGRIPTDVEKTKALVKALSPLENDYRVALRPTPQTEPSQYISRSDGEKIYATKNDLTEILDRITAVEVTIGKLYEEEFATKTELEEIIEQMVQNAVSKQLGARIAKKKDKEDFYEYIKALNRYGLRMRQPFSLKKLGYDNTEEALIDISKNTGIPEKGVRKVLNF
jgi:uncharacterized membrane protein